MKWLCHKTLLLKAPTYDSGLRHDKQRISKSYLRALYWCLCPSYWTPHVHDWPPSLLLSSPCFPLSLRVLLLSQGSVFSPQSPRSSEVIKSEIDYQICIVIKILLTIQCAYEYGLYMFRLTYCVRGALQQEINGSVYIFVAVMEGYHALILSLPSYLNQLWECKTETQSIKYNHVT